MAISVLGEGRRSPGAYSKRACLSFYTRQKHATSLLVEVLTPYSNPSLTAAGEQRALKPAAVVFHRLWWVKLIILLSDSRFYSVVFCHVMARVVTSFSLIVRYQVFGKICCFDFQVEATWRSEKFVFPDKTRHRPCETKFLLRAAVLEKAKTKSRTLKCKSFLTLAVLQNEELNSAQVIVVQEYIPFQNA
jgi:hypothetical protein